MRTRTFRLGLFAVAVFAIGLCGCVGGASAPARFYALSSVGTPGDGPGIPTGIGIGVGPVTLPGYLDRPQIVVRTGQDEVVLSEFDRWSEPLKVAVSRVLGDNFATLLKTDRIAIFPWGKSQAVQYQVALDVARFEGVISAKGTKESVREVNLEARWRVLGSDGKELTVGRSSVREAVEGSGYESLVAAMSRALGTLSRDLANAVRNLAR